jgi:hypothetical protein
MNSNISYIYIITDGINIKVGVSKEPEERLKELQTGSPYKLTLHETYKIPERYVFKVEKECHQKLRLYFTHRAEWFHTNEIGIVRRAVEKICSTYEGFCK